MTTPTRTAFHPLAVAAVERLCEDAAALTFEVPQELAADYAFRPGQSLVLRRTVAGREERRNYSICAPEGARPRIGVRRIPDGLFSAWLVDEVGPGEVIEVSTPTGSFTPGPDAGAEHVFIATGYSGTGMTFGTAAAMIITGLIVHGRHDWEHVFKPTRMKPLASAKRVLEEAGAMPYTIVVVASAGNMGRSLDGRPQYGAISAPGTAIRACSRSVSLRPGTVSPETMKPKTAAPTIAVPSPSS